MNTQRKVVIAHLSEVNSTISSAAVGSKNFRAFCDKMIVSMQQGYTEDAVRHFLLDVVVMRQTDTDFEYLKSIPRTHSTTSLTRIAIQRGENDEM